MKKIVLAAALLTAPVLLTGCGNKKTLTCTQSQLGILEAEVKLDFKKDKLSGGKITLTGDYSSLVSEDEVAELQKTDLCAEFTSGGDELESALEKCSVKWDGAKFTLTAKVTKDLGSKDKYNSLDEAKKAFEDEGYTCEVK